MFPNIDHEDKYADRWWSNSSGDDKGKEEEEAACDGYSPVSVAMGHSALLTRSYNSIQRMNKCDSMSCCAGTNNLPLLAQNSPSLDILTSVQSEYQHDKRLAGGGLAGDCTSASIRNATKPVDMSLFLGRSFRVGFDQFGRFVHPSNSSVVKVRKLTPVQDEMISKGRDAAHDRVMQVLLEASSCSVVGPMNCSLSQQYCHAPQWSLPHVNINEVQSNEPDAYVEYDKLAHLLKNLSAAFEPAAGSALKPTDRNYSILQCVRLIDAALGQEYVGIARTGRKADIIPLLESSSLYYDNQDQLSRCCAPWERRVAMMSEWLEAVSRQQLSNYRALDGASAGQNNETFDALFELLTCRRIPEAINLAECAGLWHLAMLLSQLCGDVEYIQSVALQVDKWIAACPSDLIAAAGSEESCSVIPPKLLNVYKVLGGMLIYGDDNTGSVQSVVQGVDWTRSLGMFYWYTMGYHAKMSTALRCYENALGLMDRREMSLVNYPSAPCQLHNGHTNSNKHVLYHLLLVLFPSSVIDHQMVSEDDLPEDEATLTLVTNIIEVLKPHGHTADVLDYRGSFLILSLLICFDIFSYDCVAACVVRQHMIAQLLAEKQWQWALFVACQVDGHLERTSLVKSILNQWVCMGGGSESELVVNEVERELEQLFSILDDDENVQMQMEGVSRECAAELFVIQRLNIPKEWVCEAIAMRHYQRSVSLQKVAPDCLSVGDHVLKAVRFYILAYNFGAAAELISEEIAAGWIMSGEAAAPAPTERGNDGTSTQSRLVTLLETIEDGLLQQEEELGQGPSGAVRGFYAGSSGILLEYFRIKGVYEELQVEANKLVAAATVLGSVNEPNACSMDLQVRAESLDESWYQLGRRAHDLLKRLPNLCLCSRFVAANASQSTVSGDKLVVNVAIQYDMGTMLYNIIVDLSTKLVALQLPEVAPNEMQFVLKQ